MLVDALNDFGLSLFRAVSPRDENFFFSPVSVAAALGMLLPGTRGETAQELSRALGLNVQGYEAMAALLSGASSDSVKMANRVWSHSVVPLEPEFLKALSKVWRASVGVLDFAQPVSACAEING